MAQVVPSTEKVAEKQRAHIIDYVGLEVKEHRAWYVLAA
jgi:hypothetical protein